MTWKYEKFKGDMAIYAFCPKCGFHYNPSQLNPKTMQAELKIQYHYCPMCSEHLFGDSDTVSVIWNERDIAALYEQNSEQ